MLFPRTGLQFFREYENTGSVQLLEQPGFLHALSIVSLLVEAGTRTATLGFNVVNKERHVSYYHGKSIDGRGLSTRCCATTSPQHLVWFVLAHVLPYCRRFLWRFPVRFLAAIEPRMIGAATVRAFHGDHFTRPSFLIKGIVV